MTSAGATRPFIQSGSDKGKLLPHAERSAGVRDKEGIPVNRTQAGNQTLADALRAKRRMKGMTQEQAAAELEVLQQTYANWELGSLPRPKPAGTDGAREFQEVVYRLADFLEVPVLEALRMAYLPNTDPDERDVVSIYRKRIEELEALVIELRGHNGAPPA